MDHHKNQLEVRIEVVLAALLAALFIVLSVDGYLRYVERQSVPTNFELSEENETLFKLVGDYADLQRDIKSEYLRCRNLISQGSSDQIELNYCYDFVEWTGKLRTPIF